MARRRRKGPIRDANGRFVSQGGNKKAGTKAGLATTVETRMNRVAEKKEEGQFTSLGHAAFSIRKRIKESIDRRANAGPAGGPVKTRGRRGNVRASMFAAIDRQYGDAVIGARASFVGESMAAHEHGEEFKGRKYPARPTVFPALVASAPRIGDEWRSSIGE